MIDLPEYPAPNGATPALVDFGGFNTPGLGGEVQRVDRMGNRFKAQFSFPPMPSKDIGRIFVARLIRGKTEGIRLAWPLLSFDPGAPGAIVVDGAGQAGRTLNVRSGTPYYAIREGQFFSVVKNGRHHMHIADAQIVLDASGQGAVALSPMLRVPFADGAVCHFGKPMIEGYVQGSEWAWQMSLDHNLGIEFTVEEAA
jgi:hypothetical protein